MKTNNNECKIGLGIRTNGAIGIACLTHKFNFMSTKIKPQCRKAIIKQRTRIAKMFNLPEFTGGE